jgi:hypothetical protein
MCRRPVVTSKPPKRDETDVQGGFFPVALSLAVGASVLAACEQVSSTALASTVEKIENLLRRREPAPPRPIKEAGYELIDNGNQVFWLDNDRVLFNGADYNELVPRSGDGRLIPKSALFIWDTRTDRVTRYGDIDGRLCYADGYVRYPLRGRGELVTFKIGKLGAEDERDLIFKPGEPRPEVNRFTCREFRTEDLRPTRENHLIPLREGHGFLDLGPAQKLKIVQERLEEEPIHLYPEGGKPSAALPIDKREASHLLLSYSAFNDVYLMYSAIPKSGRVGVITNWPHGKPQPLYVMRPDGQTTVIDVPYDVSRSGLANDYWLLRPGVFMISDNRYRGVEGGYLIRGGQFVRLMRGSIRAVGVSPDGCKVAVGIQPTDERERKRSTAAQLKMVNVCEGGVKK